MYPLQVEGYANEDHYRCRYLCLDRHHCRSYRQGVSAWNAIRDHVLNTLVQGQELDNAALEGELHAGGFFFSIM